MASYVLYGIHELDRPGLGMEGGGLAVFALGIWRLAQELGKILGPGSGEELSAYNIWVAYS